MRSMSDRREQLRAIRSEEGWRVAADLVGIPKKVRVPNSSNPSGYGYRTLSGKNRRDRLQRLIGGQVRADGSRDFTKVKKAQEKAISTALSDKRFPNSNARLAIQAINGERAYLGSQIPSMSLSATQRRQLERRTRPLTPAQEQSLRDSANAGDWANFRAEYDSQVAVARSTLGGKPPATPPKPDYTSFTVAQLKEELKKKGLKTTGKKADLIKRLEESA